MQFRLTYEGPLYSSQSKQTGSPHVHDVRRQIHVQMKDLWNQRPLSTPSYRAWWSPRASQGDYFIAEDRNGVTFIPLVSHRNDLLCRLDILLLRPAPPGELTKHGGDLDNRLKTFLDALRVPACSEIPVNYVPTQDETPFMCLMADDKLVTSISIETDRLLRPAAREHEVLIIAKVTVGAIYSTMGNAGLVSMGLVG